MKYENILGFSSYNDQGRLLETILDNVDTTQRMRFLEIGVYQGRMTMMWNEILANTTIDYEYYAIDHFQGSEEHEHNIDYYEITRKNLEPIWNRICLIKEDSIKTAQRFPDEYFNVIYIDASHDYESVLHDIETYYPKLKIGGIICGDDYDPPPQGNNSWPEVVQAVNEFFGKIHVNRIGFQQYWYKKTK